MTDAVTIAEAYFEALKSKDLESMSQYLHDDVIFQGPMMQIDNKKDCLEGAKQWFEMVQNIVVQSQFSNENQVMFVYDVYYPEPIGVSPTADMVTVKNGLIVKVQLFYDASPMVAMQQSQ